MMGVVDRVSVFFAVHPKHQRALEKSIAETQPKSTVSMLKDFCRTRWIQHIDALHIFQTLHISIVSCMERICADGPNLWSSDSLTDASSLQLAVTATDFICSLVVANKFLSQVSEAKDIVEAVQEISSVRAALHKARSNIDKHHRKWFQKIEKMYSDIDVEPCLPRICGRQTHHSNVPADTPS